MKEALRSDGTSVVQYECEDCKYSLIIPERKHWNGTWVCNECFQIRFNEDMIRIEKDELRRLKIKYEGESK